MEEPEKKSPKKTTKKKAAPKASTKATPSRKKTTAAKTDDASPKKTTTRKKAVATKSDEATPSSAASPVKKKTTRTTTKKTTRAKAAPPKGETEPVTEEVLPAPEPEVQDPTQALSTDEEDTSALMTNGLKFFSQLAQTLEDKEATARLVKSITKHDEKTGETYLKVPVESEKTVEDAFLMLGTLFKALQ